MATKKVLEEEIEQDLSFDESLTIAINKKDDSYKGPMVEIYLPKIEDSGNGVKVDQYEHVTIANEVGEKMYRVLRGVRTPVPVPVFVVLKEKYPDL